LTFTTPTAAQPPADPGSGKKSSRWKGPCVLFDVYKKDGDEWLVEAVNTARTAAKAKALAFGGKNQSHNLNWRKLGFYQTIEMDDGLYRAVVPVETTPDAVLRVLKLEGGS
jgi:hypothetical protein